MTLSERARELAEKIVDSDWRSPADGEEMIADAMAKLAREHARRALRSMIKNGRVTAHGGQEVSLCEIKWRRSWQTIDIGNAENAKSYVDETIKAALSAAEGE